MGNEIIALESHWFKWS